MDVSPVDPTLVFGNHHDSQVSRDGGKTWTLSGGAPNDLIDMAASSSAVERLFAAAAA